MVNADNKYYIKDVEDKINLIVSNMTLEEKVWQMGMIPSSLFMDEDGSFSRKKADKVFKGYSIGGFQDPRFEPKKSIEFIKQAQDYIKENTKPGIPAIVIGETLHGYWGPEATIFPQVIGLSSTWNLRLVESVAEAFAKEARAVGTSLSNAPDLDLARELRWGRVEETFGEDPFLVSRMGVSVIKGMQGSKNSNYDEMLIASIKHYVAHGSPEGGVNLSPVYGGERQLRELYLKPFKCAIQEAGAYAVMPAYSEYDGIPVHSSSFLLTDMLRNELGFGGITIADYGAISMFYKFHKIAKDPKDAGEIAVKAGMDFEAGDIHCYGENLIELVKEGKVNEDIINTAVKRILRVKFLAGIMECPYGNIENVKKYYKSDAHKKLALEAARESIVLLKNKDNILPLDRSIKSIAVIGPNADRGEIGDYSLPNSGISTPLQGIKEKVAGDCEVKHVEGCSLWKQSRDEFDKAVEAARSSEVAVVVVGETSIKNYGIGWGSENEEVILCGEGFDMSDLSLSGVQQQLVEAVINTGTPTIVILVNGRPLAIDWISKNAHAILEAWYPGQEGGKAIADILFGDVNPSGKLTVSFPKVTGQLPVFYNHKPSARGFYKKPGSPDKPGRDYVFLDTRPLYSFGYGLSYTTFEYSGLNVLNPVVHGEDTIHIAVRVKNTGKVTGKEVVQLYVNDVLSSVTTPVIELKGFEKVSLAPGEEKEVLFEISKSDLSIIDRNMKEIVEPGEFEVTIENLKAKFIVEN